MVKIILSKLKYMVFKLLVKLHILPLYGIDLFVTRCLYEKYGIKKADEQFHELAVDMAEGKLTYDEIENKYKHLLSISEPSSIYYNTVLSTKKRLNMVRKVMTEKAKNVKEGDIIIGIDLHGVLNYKDINVVKNLQKYMVQIKTNLPAVFWVISGGKNKETIKEELNALGYKEGVHYERVICVAEYLKSKGVKMWFDKDNMPWCEDATWWPAKAQICAEYGIDMMIDDMDRYGKHFTNSRKFVLFDNLKTFLK